MKAGAMTARARKQPDRGRNAGARKRQAPSPGLLQRSMVALGSFAARHPSVIGGGAAFAVVFSFVAANALWYQPGGHPSPIMKTRSSQNTLGFSALRKPPSDVTTFVIEREGEAGDEVPARAAAQVSGLVLDIQTALASQGLYAADPDGIMQKETADAIRRFQQARGLSVTGEPSEDLLVELGGVAAPREVAVLPTERPAETAAEKDTGTAIDPVAAAIRAAEAELPPSPAPRPAAPGPSAQSSSAQSVSAQSGSAPSTAPQSSAPQSSALVMKIQKGLSNIAYADIAVDGVAGEETREAIRAFERHYRLPATGEPNEMVLSKLKEIGAL
jgi:peptidoglycan hydrolase-like protein with peptidoglycan-binding domain